MTTLSDAAVARLRVAATWPQFESTRYAIVEAIGHGGMGTVYRATDALLGREVAIKIPNGFGGTAVGRRLRVEADVLARLEHPGIVPIHDAGQLADGRLFYVMKLVRGQTLRAHLAARPGLSERLGVFERVCEPVAFAHDRGLVHRDLKPDNIMIGAFGEVLVMDWGAALFTRPVDQATHDREADPREPSLDVIGTSGFMAPEQADSRNVDARADVFGLGAVLFLLLTDQLPPGDGPVESLAERRDLPVALRAICRRAMAARPDERYPDVESLVQDVRRYRANLAVGAHPETLRDRVVRFARTYRTAIILVVAYLVMRIMVAVATGR